MTTPRKTPAGPRTPGQATPATPHPQASEEDLAELREPYDLPFPDDRWPQGRPAYAIVVAQLRGWQPPSLAELLETGRTREPEPDLEAEP